MSAFTGFITEIPGICVDRFSKQCLNSKYLFLSHCHADHMTGLSLSTNLSTKIYTSEISAVLLRTQFPNLSNSIEPMEVDDPITLNYSTNGEEVNLTVTAISAKHCPGSVMFLFHTPQRTILYTGDFRILKSQLDEYDHIKYNLDCVYLDSTFLSDKYYEFPTQLESAAVIKDLIEEWISEHPRNKILIQMPAQYGTEFLFQTIYRKLGKKVCVDKRKMLSYIYLPPVDSYITSDSSKCDIYAQGPKDQTPSSFTGSHVRVIKPSAMYWKNWRRGLSFVEKVDKNIYRVAYSNHCSCSELGEFLRFVKPKKVTLNTIQENERLESFKCLEKIYPLTNRRSFQEKVPFGDLGTFSIQNETQSDLPLGVPSKRQRFT